MKEGDREWGNSTERKAAGREGRKRWRGNLLRAGWRQVKTEVGSGIAMRWEREGPLDDGDFGDEA